MAALITDRELNLSTLARQFLLRRAEVSALDAIEHLAGLQAQAPNPPYLALWARLKNFAAEDLSTLVEKRQVVRLVAMPGHGFCSLGRGCGPLPGDGSDDHGTRSPHQQHTACGAHRVGSRRAGAGGTRPGSRRAAYPNADEGLYWRSVFPATRQKGWHTEFADCCRWCRFHREVCGDDPEHRH